MLLRRNGRYPTPYACVPRARRVGQAVWLGRHISSGAPWVDSLITDATAVPPDHSSLYTESLIYLPGSAVSPPSPPPPLLKAVSAAASEPGAVKGELQTPPPLPAPLSGGRAGASAGDAAASSPAAAAAAAAAATAAAADKERRRAGRAGLGLREDVLTFAGLGPAGRVDPGLWGVWMEALRFSAPSQLIFAAAAAAAPHAARNLRWQAEHAGILPARVLVTGSDAAAVAAVADMVLDTRALNAAAADVLAALRGGAAVLSLPGDCAGRRSTASMLAGHGLAGLLTARDVTDYEELAVRVAAALRRRGARLGCRGGACLVGKRPGGGERRRGMERRACRKSSGGAAQRAEDDGQESGEAGVLGKAWAMAWEVAELHRDAGAGGAGGGVGPASRQRKPHNVVVCGAARVA